MTEAQTPGTPPTGPPRPPPRLRGQARALALQIAAESRAEWAYTSEVIARSFRTHRELHSAFALAMRAYSRPLSLIVRPCVS